jgi:hypothetical protein
MLDAMTEQKLRRAHMDAVTLTAEGARFVAKLGIDLSALDKSRRPLCKTCLDWSVRRSHLAGSLGAAILARLYELKWARRELGNRVVTFTPKGATRSTESFGAKGD